MLIQNANLVANGTIQFCDIAIQNGVISQIAPAGTLCDQQQTINAKGLYLSHGFVDAHVHGGGGHDFMDGTQQAWQGAARLHLTHGTTCMVPTTLASTKEELLRAFSIYEQCKQQPSEGAKFLGLHIEGPYLSPHQCGAQDPAFVRNPNPEEYMQLLDACPDILRWTIAPELEGALEMGDRLTTRGVMPCIGHSNADEEEVRTAMLHGYHVVTHLYSAMSTITRRQGFRHAGILECAYLYPNLTSEIIADGCHVPQSLLQMAYRLIGPDRLCLVTDAMRAAGQTHGESILGSLEHGQRVLLEDGVAKMPDRQAFAGSICTTDRLVRNMVTLAGATLPEAIKMMTEVPARTLGLSHKTGTVGVGRAADLVLFDPDINIKLAMVDGEIRYRTTI